jgi:alkanesulfonate monooxygenase SsuD/methylene tetrahydromethanopterin reductase-like flavin-dependent oxidoreductase (luciferase family)/hemerythrin-like domain-containing protein
VTDYGHDLLFGTFLTPAAGRPGEVVELARRSEQAGIDLVTFQDHPYQPAFLDTWTLMSYVAAATSRIRLTTNVLNLPLRQPVVIARSAASLDLLSGGRVELGIGAGGFWDAIEASGGRRLTGGQAVDALAEAVAIIRQVWAAGERGGVRLHGEYYQVTGAKRGPAPAHDVGIWVGAYKPRMLELTGRLADGWLPSLSYLARGQAELPDMNARIDDAARAAGRAPAAVRRLLNISGQFTSTGSGVLTGPPDQWAEELAGMALDHGISGFILMADDPAIIETFAAEVAPAVRELVAAERARPGAAPKPADEAAPVVPTGQLTGFAARPTPDPGVRLSSQRRWDESTRPLAPPAPAGYSYTARAQATGRHLLDVHDHLRDELAQLRDLLEQVQQGARSAGRVRALLHDMAMRQNNWTLGAYCAAYCTLVTQHHALEDTSIFPHLRRADAGLAPVLDRLEAEHVAIHSVVEGLDRALVDHIRDRSDFAPVREALDLLTDTLLSHLAYEEQQIMEPIARYGFYQGQV